MGHKFIQVQVHGTLHAQWRIDFLSRMLENYRGTDELVQGSSYVELQGILQYRLGAPYPALHSLEGRVTI